MFGSRLFDGLTCGNYISIGELNELRLLACLVVYVSVIGVGSLDPV